MWLELHLAPACSADVTFLTTVVANGIPVTAVGLVVVRSLAAIASHSSSGFTLGTASIHLVDSLHLVLGS